MVKVTRLSRWTLPAGALAAAVLTILAADAAMNWVADESARTARVGSTSVWETGTWFTNRLMSDWTFSPHSRPRDLYETGTGDVWSLVTALRYAVTANWGAPLHFTILVGCVVASIMAGRFTAASLVFRESWGGLARHAPGQLFPGSAWPWRGFLSGAALGLVAASAGWYVAFPRDAGWAGVSHDAATIFPAVLATIGTGFGLSLALTLLSARRAARVRRTTAPAGERVCRECGYPCAEQGVCSECGVAWPDVTMRTVRARALVSVLLVLLPVSLFPLACGLVIRKLPEESAGRWCRLEDPQIGGQYRYIFVAAGWEYRVVTEAGPFTVSSAAPASGGETVLLVKNDDGALSDSGIITRHSGYWYKDVGEVLFARCRSPVVGLTRQPKPTSTDAH